MVFTQKEKLNTQSVNQTTNRWRNFQENFKAMIGERQFEVFGSLLELVDDSDDPVVAVVPREFQRDWLEEKHGQALKESFQQLYPDKKALKINVANSENWEDNNSANDINDKQNVKRAFPFARNTQLNPAYTFDNFIVGSTNEYAYSAAWAVAEDPATYNPLFIYGGVGLGKTHLLQAVGHRVKELWSQANIKYVSAEKFTNEIIQAIREGNKKEFKYRYRTTDMFLVDDIQFLAKTDTAQEEFFHTFNELYESGKGIVLCSDCPPHEIPRIEERLRSRFEMGFTVDVKPPDYETRAAILQKKASQSGIVVPDEVINIIAGNVTSNIRILEGCLNRLAGMASFSNKEITAEMAQRELASYMKSCRQLQSEIVSLSAIQEAVAEHFSISVADLKSKRRTKAIAFPRQIAMYMSRDLTDSSFAEIGEAFGGRDHSTVIHAENKIKDEMEENNSRIALHMRQIEASLNS
ncbi:MAG: chromosomal replication initiator protein DnaA [bacterium]